MPITRGLMVELRQVSWLHPILPAFPLIVQWRVRQCYQMLQLRVQHWFYTIFPFRLIVQAPKLSKDIKKLL